MIKAIPIEVINKPFGYVVLQGPVAAISIKNLLFSKALPHAESEHTALLLLAQQPPENLQILFVRVAPVRKRESQVGKEENGENESIGKRERFRTGIFESPVQGQCSPIRGRTRYPERQPAASSLDPRSVGAHPLLCGQRPS